MSGEGTGVWSAERRGLSLGLVLTITMLAFENLGVSTAMPVVARDLDGVNLYGWTFTAALLGSLVGIALAGGRVDRDGPGRAFVGGLLLFTAGIVVAGLAPTMKILVAARFVQGLGVGAVPAVVYASIGRAFEERARARMFALLSTAWVVPGLIGPAVSGAVAESIGWRWVFFGVLPLVPVNAALTAPALLRLGPPPSESVPERDRRTVPFAMLLALAAAFVVGGLNNGTLLGAPFVIVGIVAAVQPLRRLLPPGTVRAAPGIPAAVATRGMTTLAFFTAQAFLPLTLTELRDQPATFAGIALTVSTLTWTAGAWLQDKRGHVWGRRTLVVAGLGVLVAGIASTLLLVFDEVPVGLAVVTWAVAGLGMGMVYSGLSLIVLAEAAVGEEGRASSSLQLAEQICIAMGTGLAGAAVAAADRSGRLLPGLAVAFGLATAAAVAGNVSARRIRTSDAADAEELVPSPLGLVPDPLDPGLESGRP
ncbi:MAG TPA: MFS transporter [Acidimicrobiales bacterium]|nr:MFS transporter [Acidimicrobiales bacterium]